MARNLPFGSSFSLSLDYLTDALAGNEARVVRGGAFDSDWASVRSAVRYNNGPDDRRPYLGFRVAASPNHP